MPLSLLCDEHIPYAIVNGLVARGIDAISVQRLGFRSADDPPILDLAHRESRAFYTHDEHFLILNAGGVQHSGILFHRAKKYNIGQAIEMVQLACETLSPEEMRNRVEFL